MTVKMSETLTEKYSSDEDDEVDVNVHNKMLEALGKIDKTQHIKKATRNEPVLKTSEFNLVKGSMSEQSKRGGITINDLVKVLNKTSKHGEVGKQIKSTQKNTKTLEKPLERPEAERIQRTIGYEKSKEKLERWEALVQSNRNADQLEFPLKNDEMDYSKPAKQNPFSDIRIKSDLMMKMDALLSDGPDSENDDDKDGDFPLTLEEIVEKRKEMMKLKMKESHKIAKARRQSKIKSKKYHKLLKREKIKEQMKEFEILQKTDPEAALKKLEQIDRHRVEERANLRHKNTGTWAKNLQVRAKYDKDVRKELAQQLNVGRELTQKQKIIEDSSASENENEYGDDYDPFNPWMNKKKAEIEKGEEVENLVTGYKKYWETRNSNEKKRKIFDEIVVEDDSVELDSVVSEKPIIQIKKKVKRIEKVKKVEVISTESNWEVESFDSDSSQNPEEVEVENFKTKQSLEEIFDVVEDNLALKLKNKLHEIQNQEIDDEFEPKSKKNRKSDKKSDLAFKNKSNRPEIDESLDESGDKNKSKANEEIDSIKKISSADVAVTKEVTTIDPNEFVAMKPKYLQTAIPDMNNYDENIDDDENESRAVAEKTMTIAEAFAEDDIVADFVQAKDDEKKKDLQENIDMTLPGWGSWGGTGIKKASKNKRFVLKFPKEIPRRDDNKDSVILYEDSNEKIKSHLVSDLPFPFTSVSDFEASIRAPIGNEFVTQIAHKALTKPPIKTKLGTVIQPMDENNLISSLRTVKPKTKTDIKIHNLMTNRSKKV